MTGLMYVDEDDEHAMADADHAVVSIVPPRAATEEVEDEDAEDLEADEDTEGGDDSTDGDSSDES